MDFLREYEFDALSYVDKEYDNEIVKEVVDRFISEEMKTFKPTMTKYLSHLPKYDYATRETSLLQMDMKRLKTGSSTDKVDLKRYIVEQPDEALEQDVQAWRRCISNAKSQFENQLNTLMNLELAEKNAANVWLHHNKVLENRIEVLKKSTDDVNNEIMKINHARKTAQEEVYRNLEKLQTRRDTAILKAWQIRSACEDIQSKVGKEDHSMMDVDEEKAER